MNLSVTFIDFLVVAVLLVSAGYAAWRGFLSEVLTIFAWAAAAFATLYAGPYIVPMAQSIVTTPWIAYLVGYAVVFLAVFIPLSFMSHRLSQNVKNSPIGPLDRVLGIVFGVVRGLAIVGVAYIAFSYFVAPSRQPAWLADARLLPLIQSSSEVLLSLVPDQDKVGEARASDPVADVIRRSQSRATPAAAASKPGAGTGGQKATPRYGAGDRRALDRLIESTGSGNR